MLNDYGSIYLRRRPSDCSLRNSVSFNVFHLRSAISIHLSLAVLLTVLTRFIFSFPCYVEHKMTMKKIRILFCGVATGK